jgi:hypothetical protein
MERLARTVLMELPEIQDRMGLRMRVEIDKEELVELALFLVVMVEAKVEMVE